MNKSFKKIISFTVMMIFAMGQIQPGFADKNLATVPIGDNGIGVERPGVKEAIMRELDPGTIGRGMPWEALFRGELPDKIDLKGIPFSEVINGNIPEGAEVNIMPESLRKIVAAIHLSIDRAQTNLDKVPQVHQTRTRQTITNLLNTLTAIYQSEFDRVHLFNARAVIIDSDNYLLGFNYDNVPGLAVDLIDFLSLDEAAEYIFHEHVPAEHEIEHKIVYKEMQAPIFWGRKGNVAGRRFREFIDTDGGITDAEITVTTTGTNIPTRKGIYARFKRLFVRSAFGDQLVFGTSGIREFVKNLQDIKTFSIGKAILSYMNEIGEPGAMAVAGDLRPSTPRLMTLQIMAAEQMGKQVIYGGEVPTSAIVYYGMYREEGAVPSSMVTASHCPVLPPAIEQNGIKPNRTTGEVLKEDERRILKHVREFMEIEFMMDRKQSMFDDNGRIKDRKELSGEQQALLERVLEIQDEIEDEVRRMYVDRYVKGFGEIFGADDHMAGVEHMEVGRDMIEEIFLGIGAKYTPYERNSDWVEGLIVDTEDIRPELAKIIERIVGIFKKSSKRLMGVFTTDGDSDRPALFQEDGKFVYGDKLGYLASEYIHNLKDNVYKKMFVAVTATVSDAVIRRMESLGIEVAVVKIGSPYVVKAMEDRLARAEREGEEVIVAGFERNGGYLLGSDIVLDNGNVLKALPTRDAVLPIIAAFHTAKREGRTIGELARDRFSGEYSSFAWSGLIEASTIDKDSPENTELCKQYTATMGQAIMRSFSPRDLNVVEVEFHPDGSIDYLMADGDKFHADSDDEFAKDMHSKKKRLEGYFNAERGFAGGIDKIGFLDGVRIFLKTEDTPEAEIEIVHMRPSGNAPQWRIYAEAATLERAMEMTEYKLPVYPQIIGEYLKEKEKFKGMGIIARDNQAMKDTFKGVFDTKQDEWTTWEMTFGARGEHSSWEKIIFGGNNSSIGFHQTKFYDVSGDLGWLAKGGPTEKELVIVRSIIWDREDRTLSAREIWSDGRKTTVTLSGKDAWLEIGRGLDKNTPMGKFQDMPFPVMSDKAREYFKGKGINWFDLFDVSVESEFTVEAPMWAHNFNFQKGDTPGDDAPPGVDTPEEDPRIEKILKPTTPGELMRAQEFYAHNMIENLRKLVAKDPGTIRLLAIDMGIGGEYQQVVTNNLLKQISELQGEGEFENLLTTRAKNAEELLDQVNGLVEETEGLHETAVVIITRNVDIENHTYSDLEGNATIAGIEDRGEYAHSYMPILETIAIALGIEYGADYEVIKSMYDIITEDEDTLTVSEYKYFIANGVIVIIPRAEAFDTKDLRKVYQRAREALIRA